MDQSFNERDYESEKREDDERWARYLSTGHAVPQESAMKWLEDLAKGKQIPRPE